MPNAPWTRAIIVLAAVLASAALFVSGKTLNLDLYKALLSASGAVVLILWIFDTWAWRWPVIQRFVPRRVVHGTWSGTLQTTWKDPETGETPGPIPCFLAVHQTYSTVELTLLTEESRSRSVVATISDPAKGQCLLSSIYMNTPDLLIQDRSRIHHGGLVLEMRGRPVKRLSGQYWTDRDTKGQLELSAHISEIVEDFAEAGARFQPAAAG